MIAYTSLPQTYNALTDNLNLKDAVRRIYIYIYILQVSARFYTLHTNWMYDMRCNYFVDYRNDRGGV